MNITIYADSGHAWGKVNRALLNRLGIEAQISPFSYQREQYVYLEEDCDLMRLFHALDAQGIKYEIKDRLARYAPSKIRTFESYKSEVAN
jgi:ATP-dependent Zn protease